MFFTTRIRQLALLPSILWMVTPVMAIAAPVGLSRTVSRSPAPTPTMFDKQTPAVGPVRAKADVVVLSSDRGVVIGIEVFDASQRQLAPSAQAAWSAFEAETPNATDKQRLMALQEFSDPLEDPLERVEKARDHVAPDLVVTDVEALGLEAGRFYARYRVENQWIGDAGPFVVEIVLSTDLLVDERDVVVGRETIKGLRAGAAHPGRIALEVGHALPGGGYFLGAIVDPQDEVFEANPSGSAEQNNAWVGDYVELDGADGEPIALAIAMKDTSQTYEYAEPEESSDSSASDSSDSSDSGESESDGNLDLDGFILPGNAGRDSGLTDREMLDVSATLMKSDAEDKINDPRFWREIGKRGKDKALIGVLKDKLGVPEDVEFDSPVDVFTGVQEFMMAGRKHSDSKAWKDLAALRDGKMTVEDWIKGPGGSTDTGVGTGNGKLPGIPDETRPPNGSGTGSNDADTAGTGTGTGSGSSTRRESNLDRPDTKARSDPGKSSGGKKNGTNSGDNSKQEEPKQEEPKQEEPTEEAKPKEAKKKGTKSGSGSSGSGSGVMGVHRTLPRPGYCPDDDLTCGGQSSRTLTAEESQVAKQQDCDAKNGVANSEGGFDCNWEQLGQGGPTPIANAAPYSYPIEQQGEEAVPVPIGRGIEKDVLGSFVDPTGGIGGGADGKVGVDWADSIEERRRGTGGQNPEY